MISAINNALLGLQNASKQVEQGAANIASDSNPDNLIQDIVDIKVAETSYKANLKVLQVADDLTKELLNTFDETV
jgi:flagellar hook-associated protein FlgK